MRAPAAIYNLMRGLTIVALLMPWLLPGIAAAEEVLANWKAHLEEAVATQDCSRANQLARAITQTDDPIALFVLGAVFEEGAPCLDQDHGKAAALFGRAASVGENLAKLRLGSLYLEGAGVTRDETKARQLFLEAVIAFAPLNADARDEMFGALFDDREMPPPLRAALAWIRNLKAQGPEAVFALAKRLRTGRGVPRNEDVAEKLMIDVALGGLVEAQYELGLWHMRRAENQGGLNQASSMRYLMIAAEHGHPTAQAALGQHLASGDRRDKNVAYVWLLRARANGAEVGQLLLQLEGLLSADELAAARAMAAEPTSTAIE